MGVELTGEWWQWVVVLVVWYALRCFWRGFRAGVETDMAIYTFEREQEGKDD